jgi:hypothetical protein
LLRDFDAHAFLGFRRGSTQVRRENNVAQFLQREIRGRRFLLKNIKGRRCNLLCF